jgi:integrase
MPKIKMTELGIRGLKPTPDKQIDYFDDPAHGGVPGLFLRVSSGGTKAWRVVWYPPGQKGKARTHGLKRYPIYGLAKARTEAKKFLADPDEALREEMQDDFQTVWEQYLKRHVKAQGLRSHKQTERTVKFHVLPDWKNKRFTEIRRGDVARLLDKIEDRSSAKQADAVLSIIRKIAVWFQSRNENYISPIVPGMRKTNPLDARRKRKLTDDEIRTLWSVTATMPKYGALVRIILLTAQRRTKVAMMKRADLKGDTWTIATATREKNNAGIIKLPKLALDIINAQPKLNSTDYVFPAGRGLGPFNAFATCFTELKEQMRETLPDMPDFVLHDLRRTARSLMSRAGVRPDIAERCLGHLVGTPVEQTYDRHDYDIETAQAFESLATLVTSILNPSVAPNVIPLRG